MKNIFHIIVFFLISCSSNQETKIPSDIIQPNKMSDVFLDIHLMQSHIAQERIIDPYVLDSVNAFYNAIYKKHNITKAQYDSSLVFYSQNVTILDSIYDNMYAELKNLELKMKDVKYNVPDIKYLSRKELLVALNQLEFKDYLIQDSVTFLQARDSLNKFVKNNINLMDSINIAPVQLRNSFSVYANSKKRMEELKKDLVKN